jgi:hypothetical protein
MAAAEERSADDEGRSTYDSHSRRQYMDIHPDPRGRLCPIAEMESTPLEEAAERHFVADVNPSSALVSTQGCSAADHDNPAPSYYRRIVAEKQNVKRTDARYWK